VAAAYGFELRPGQATFLDQHALAVNGQPLRARTYMVATGSYSAAPDLPGLDLGLLESHVPAPDHQQRLRQDRQLHRGGGGQPVHLRRQVWSL
jgi:hypothetical protein